MMGLIYLMTTLLLLTSCGEVKDLGQAVIDLPSTVAKDFLRLDKDDDVKDYNQDKTLEELESRVTALETANELNNKLVNINSNQIITNVEQISVIEGILNDLQTQINAIEGDLLALDASQSAQIASITTQLTNIDASIDLLEQASQSAIKELIDPCGDKPGHFDEILIVLNSGELIAYFEQGNKRFLTVLSDGNYQTTDAQKCNFSVLGGIFSE